MLVVHAQQGQRGQAEGTGEERKKHDFDRRKVGALDREASRGWHNRKLSMSSSSREKERLALAGARDSAFSVPWVLPPLLSTRYNRTAYFISSPLCRTENLTNGPSPPAAPYTRVLASRWRSIHEALRPLPPLSPPLSLSIRLEIFAHLSHKRNRFAPVYTQ